MVFRRQTNWHSGHVIKLNVFGGFYERYVIVETSTWQVFEMWNDSVYAVLGALIVVSASNARLVNSALIIEAIAIENQQVICLKIRENEQTNPHYKNNIYNFACVRFN